MKDKKHEPPKAREEAIQKAHDKRKPVARAKISTVDDAKEIMRLVEEGLRQN